MAPLPLRNDTFQQLCQFHLKVVVYVFETLIDVSFLNGNPMSRVMDTSATVSNNRPQHFYQIEDELQAENIQVYLHALQSNSPANIFSMQKKFLMA